MILGPPQLLSFLHKYLGSTHERRGSKKEKEKGEEKKKKENLKCQKTF